MKLIRDVANFRNLYIGWCTYIVMQSPNNKHDWEKSI